MAIQQRLHNVDTLWELAQVPENDTKRFYMIDGELYDMSPANRLHGRLALTIGSRLMRFVEERDLGEVNVEVGYHLPDDRHTSR